HAHGQAHKADHEVSHGPADSHGSQGGGHAVAHDADAAHDDHGGGHGHGPWHGPHESPRAMTFPLQALAVGAVIAGFLGIPTALGGGNAIEHFLEPSFTAEHRAESAINPQSEVHNPQSEEPHVSRGVELGLMA